MRPQAIVPPIRNFRICHSRTIMTPHSNTPANSAENNAIEATILPIILAVALGHLLNDLMQSLISASYPLLKSNLALTFTQIGLITMVFQGTGRFCNRLSGFTQISAPCPMLCPRAWRQRARGGWWRWRMREALRWCWSRLR